MRLLRLKINNLFCFNKVNINFEKLGPGIVLIDGINENDPNKSNSTGKTYLLETINWILFDDIIKSSLAKNKDRAIRDGEKEGTGILEFQINKDIIKIEKTRKKGSTLISVEVNGEDKKIKTSTDGKLFIESLIGISFDTWKHSVFLGQNKSSLFLTGSSKEKSDLFGNFLNFELLDACLKYTREVLLKDYQDKIDKADSEIGSNVQIISENSTVNGIPTKDILSRRNAELAEKIKEINVLKDTISSLSDIDKLVKEKYRISQKIESLKEKQGFDKSEYTDRQESIKRALKLYEEQIKQIPDLLIKKEAQDKIKLEIKEIENQVSSLNTEIQIENADLATNTKIINSLNKKLANLTQGDICDSCGQEITHDCVKHIENDIEAKNKVLSGIQEKINKLNIKKTKLQKDKQLLENKIENSLEETLRFCEHAKKDKSRLVNTYNESVKQYNNLVVSVKEHIEELDFQLREIQIDENFDESEFNNLKISLKEKELDIKTLSFSISEVESKIKMCEIAEKNIKKLKDEILNFNIDKEKVVQAESVFGQAGVRNNLIQGIQDIFETKIGEYLTQIDKGNIEFKLTFDPKFDIEVYSNNFKRFFGDFSGSELKLFSIICNLVLSDIILSSGIDIKFKIFDEVVDNLDTFNTVICINLLKDIAIRNNEQILAITHSHFAKDILESSCVGKITCNHKNGVTDVQQL